MIQADNDACEKDFVILRVPAGVVSFAAVQ